jgi:uncharacterized protein (UPF0332 family)
VSAETDALMDKARRSLANARRSVEAGDADFAASRAYYAMFYAAEALFLARGRTFSKHAALIAEFNREFVRGGDFAREHADALREAFGQRHVADYAFDQPFPPARAQKLIQQAERFMQAAEDWLRANA